MIRALTFAVAILIPAASAAQATGSDEISEVRSEARGHVGPFYFTPKIHLKELGIDSNVFNEAGERKSDLTVNLSPGVTVWMPMARRALLKTTLATDFVWYAEYDSERSINPQSAVRGEVYLNRITLFGEHAYVNTRERANHELDLRLRHAEDTVTAGARISVTPRFSLEAAGRRHEVAYDSDARFDGASLQRTLNRETRGLQVTARHRLTPLTTLALRYDVRRDRFALSPERDSDSFHVMPGVEFAPKALLKGTAYVGYRQFTPVAPSDLPAFSGLVADLGLSYTLLGATSFGVRYRRDLTYSYSELQPFFIDNSVGVSVRRALGGRFDTLLSADRHEYDYRQAAGLEAALPPRVDTTWSYGASVGYRVGRDGRLAFGVAYMERESIYPSRAYDNVRFGTTFSYGF